MSFHGTSCVKCAMNEHKRDGNFSTVDLSKASFLCWRHAEVPSVQNHLLSCSKHAWSWSKDHTDSNWSCRYGYNQCGIWFYPFDVSSKSKTWQILNQVEWSPRNLFLDQAATSSHQKAELLNRDFQEFGRGFVINTHAQDQAFQVVSKLGIAGFYCWNFSHACGQ